ncbi:MAG: hypothetical protein IT449_16700 [Phycisphaerales bacterium]|nr:hypothetical protein [Phycisphaerales bacterium]
MSFAVFLVCPLILSWNNAPASALSAVPAASVLATSTSAAALPAPFAAPASADPACAVAPVPMRATYTWTGNGSNDRWDNIANWSYVGGGYPDDCNDDAVVPFVSGGYDVVLITESIDDLTMEGSLDLTAASGDDTLTVDSLTIVGGVVTFGNGTRIDTVSSCQP